MKKTNTNIQTQIDHLVLGCSTLEEGIAYVQKILGVSPYPGGKHVKMGTHNYLLKLGEDRYLEIIAVDPNGNAPAFSRWFGLDSWKTGDPPRLLTWVARVNALNEIQGLTPIDFGTTHAMSRPGLEWLIAIPPRGTLPKEGIAPTLIEWKTSVHPASQLPYNSCRLIRLEGYHPDAFVISEALDLIGFHGPFVVQTILPDTPPMLIAYIDTPSGIQKLST